MPQTITKFELVGFKELHRELQMLSKNVQRKGINYMCAEGAAVVRDAAIPKVYRAGKRYWAYIAEKMGEYSGLTIGGRSKWGGMRTEFNPGHVAKNIRIGKVKSKSRGGVVFWRIFLTPQAWFGRFIEYGASANGIPAKPFMRPALKENIGKILDTMRNALGKFIKTQHYLKIVKVRGGTPF
jgi:HK97 gp10 family phage protein